MISQNLGIIANTRGNLEAALESYATSLRLYRALGLESYVPFVLNNMAHSLAHLRE